MATGEIFGGGSRSWNKTTGGVNPEAAAIAYGANFAQDSAEQNLAAQPSLEALSKMVNAINQQANLGRIPGGAALEEQSSQNIANQLAGNLPDSFINNLQSGMAQRGATGGMGVDSPNMNAAALRSMGLESIDLQNQGQQNLNLAYNRAAPLWGVEQGMITPGLLETYGQHQAQNQLQRDANAAAQAQWQAELAQRNKEYEGLDAYRYAALKVQESGQGAAAAAQVRAAEIQADQLNNQLAERMREYNITHDTQVLSEINQLRQAADMAKMDASYKQNALNAQIWEVALKYMTPMSANFAASGTSIPNYTTTNIPQFNYAPTPSAGNWNFQPFKPVTSWNSWGT
jgi:hypothetical protein